jgi:cellulose synthase/poly-beta-1,6-N-acetylglucosamine synthase-like glycosyltransferase
MDGVEARGSLTSAAASMDAASLADASFGFDRRFPQLSARRRLHLTQALVIVLLVGCLVWALQTAPGRTFELLHAAATALFATAIAWRLIAAAFLQPHLSRIAEPKQWPTYTVLCPVYREVNVLPDLVAAIQRLDYPKAALDVKLLVEGDDVDTLTVALAFSGAPHIEVVIVPPAAPRTKPKALNAGLARARGEYVVVYDAEDRPHPLQLRAALAAFEDGNEKLACVQAPLAIDNADASWIAGQFATEYEIQFREMLPLLARAGLPLPLGGSSNHFRIEALRAAGGWDPYNVTEDADLGYRLARAGYAADVVAPPTWEEAPITLKAWRAQRTRWIKGHLQTWLVLMRNPVQTAREMGLKGFAAMQLMLGGGLLAAFAHGPLALFLLASLLTPFKLAPLDFVLALSGYCVALFAALTACALSGNAKHALRALTMPFYWPLSTIAATCALVEFIIAPHRWSKTTHGVSARSKKSGKTAEIMPAEEPVRQRA